MASTHHLALGASKRALSIFEEFKQFAFKGNVIDLAVSASCAAAFGKIIDSLVKHLIMPLISVVVTKAKKEQAAAPPSLTKDQELLTEICDLLARNALR